jgi:hypothetical protein
MTAATVASTATVVLPSVAVEMGRGFGEGSGLGSCLVSSLPLAVSFRVAKGGCARCPGRRKLVPNLGHGQVGPRELVWMGHTAVTRHNGPPVRSDQFGHARTVCITRWRCPYN